MTDMMTRPKTAVGKTKPSRRLFFDLLDRLAILVDIVGTRRGGSGGYARIVAGVFAAAATAGHTFRKTGTRRKALGWRASHCSMPYGVRRLDFDCRPRWGRGVALARGG